jgi:DNA ligase-1
VIDGRLRSRSLKPIPNKYTSALFSRPELAGLDGELVVGEATAEDVFRVTSAATSAEKGSPDVRFFVFDHFDATGGFEERQQAVKRAVAKAGLGDRVVIVEQRFIHNSEELLAFEEEMLEAGYEGLILRSRTGPYKQGRSTVNEGWMLKLKRFTDSEAEILGVIEEMENTNDAHTNALGRTERSSCKSGLKPKGRAGALRVRDLKTGIEFNVGGGFNSADRDNFWTHRAQVIGMVLKYKSFLIGVKDAPRFPIYLGMRNDWDRS